MLIYRVFALSLILAVVEGLIRRGKDHSARQAPELASPTCRFQRQKELGLCGPGTGIQTETIAEPNTETTSSYTTSMESSWTAANPTLTTSTLVTSKNPQDGVTKTMVVISGGPITSTLTLPGPLPSKLDPSGAEVKSSVFSISSIISSTLPTVTAWIDNPEKAQGSAAIEAVQPIVTIVGGLTNNLPGGIITAACDGFTSDDSSLIQHINLVMCRLLNVILDLRTGISAAGPEELNPIISGVRSGLGEASSEISSAAAVIDVTQRPSTTLIASTINSAITPGTSNAANTEVSSTTETVPITITTLPEGAQTSTITKVSYTSPTYITTTTSEGGEPTIVPVIIPFSGPPILCFGCYTSFPPNIAIRVPEFCVQLFGLNIGNCPLSDDDNTTEDENKDDEKTNEEQSATSNDQSATSTLSSCTTTITATHESVFCSVSKTNSPDGPPPTVLGCSTTAYTTITSCSGSNSATTTTTEISAPTEWLCEQNTCGRYGCPASQKRSQVASPHELQERGNPSQGIWPDPSDYANQQDFMIQESRKIKDKKTGYEAKEVLLTTEDMGNHLTSHNWISFKDNVGALSVRGLYGCTSVVVLSQRGAWASHIWEPAFYHEQEAFFLDRGITGIHMGVGSDHPYATFMEYGIDHLMKDPEAGDHGVMFGDGTPADATLPIQVFLFAPRPRPEVGLPQDVRQNPNYREGSLLYGQRLEYLHKDMMNTFAKVKIDVIDYAPRVPTEKQDAEKLINPVRDIIGDTSISSPRGKLLIQYQPAQSCAGQASWRVWVEDRPLEGRTSSWYPAQNQIFQGQTAQRPAEKRQVCPVRSAVPSSAEHSQQSKPSGSEQTMTAPGPGHSGTTAATTQGSTTAISETVTSVDPSSLQESTASETLPPKVTTAVPPPPAPTTKAQPPPAEPTEQVIVEYLLEKEARVLPNQPIISKGHWVMFLKKVDDTSRRECDDRRVGYKKADDDIKLADSWPPTIFAQEADFTPILIAGRKDCRYIEKIGGGGPGSFTCSGLGQFECIEDEQSKGKKSCGAAPMQADYYPKVRCLLPIV